MIATPDLSFANDHGNLPHKQKFSNSPVVNLILCVCVHVKTSGYLVLLPLPLYY